MPPEAAMSQPDWEALEGEVHELARRLTRVEHELGIAERRVGAGAHPVPVSQESAVSGETSALMPALGRALLGLAGAYLLRALTESGTLPHRGGVAIGIV